MQKFKHWMVHIFEIVAPALIVFVTPIGWAIAMVGGLMFSDTILAIMGSKKLGKKFEWPKFRDGFFKIVAYVIVIFLCRAFELYVIDFPAVKVLAAFIAYNELMSIDIHVEVLTGRKMLGFLINKLKEITKK